MELELESILLPGIEEKHKVSKYSVPEYGNPVPNRAVSRV